MQRRCGNRRRNRRRRKTVEIESGNDGERLDENWRFGTRVAEVLDSSARNMLLFLRDVRRKERVSKSTHKPFETLITRGG